MILKSFKQALMRKLDERTKEKEELNVIENEQRAVPKTDSVSEKKTKCKKMLGEKVYNEAYNYLKKVKTKNIPHKTMVKEINNIVGKGNNKMKAILILKQIIDNEYTKP